MAVSLPFVTFKGGTLTRHEQRRRQVIVAGLAAVSFATYYAASLPSFFFGTPILTIRLSQWAAVVAIVLALFLPTIAKALRVRR